MPGRNGLCMATSLNCWGASPPTPTEIHVLLRGTCLSAFRSTAGAATVGAAVGAGAAGAVVGFAAAGACVGAAAAVVGAAAGLATVGAAAAAVGFDGAAGAHAARSDAAPKPIID